MLITLTTRALFEKSQATVPVSLDNQKTIEKRNAQAQAKLLMPGTLKNVINTGNIGIAQAYAIHSNITQAKSTTLQSFIKYHSHKKIIPGNT